MNFIVYWKDEDEDDQGRAIGPVRLMAYGANKLPVFALTSNTWHYRSEARQLAERLGAKFEES